MLPFDTVTVIVCVPKLGLCTSEGDGLARDWPRIPVVLSAHCGCG
jgi:hypothetical protein